MMLSSAGQCWTADPQFADEVVKRMKKLAKCRKLELHFTDYCLMTRSGLFPYSFYPFQWVTDTCLIIVTFSMATVFHFHLFLLAHLLYYFSYLFTIASPLTLSH